ncbi:MAG: MFS transporter [Gammaproteobacteria bacterium]|nr:MFS transporter [Chromatiales bacterium]MYE49821.1 MFS transporter [Gammaproteobacteria bacterium]
MAFAHTVARLPVFYGWVIVGCMFLLLWTAHGLTLAGIPVFDELILEELGISRGTLKFRDFITVMCAGLSGPLVGYLADRYGARPVILAGLLFLSAALFLYSTISSPTHIYLIHVLMGLCFSATNIVVIVVLLSNWFVTRRGIALGLALAGTSLGSAFIPQLSAWLIGQMHWRDAAQVLGCLPIVLIPVLYFLIRERPADLGVQPLGGEAAPRTAPAGPQDIDMREVWAQVRTFNFVLLGVIAALIFYTSNAFIQHTFLYLRDQGFEPSAAATGFTIIFVSGLVGKIASGFLVEKWGVKPIWVAFQGLMLAGALVMVFQGADGVWIGLSCIGFGWGGAYALTQLFISNTFPPHALGRLMGLFVVIEAVGAGSGSWLTGVMFDAQGSYDLAFLLTVGFMLAAIVGTRFLRARPS